VTWKAAVGQWGAGGGGRGAGEGEKGGGGGRACSLKDVMLSSSLLATPPLAASVPLPGSLPPHPSFARSPRPSSSLFFPPLLVLSVRSSSLTFFQFQVAKTWRAFDSGEVCQAFSVFLSRYPPPTPTLQKDKRERARASGIGRKSES